MIPSSGQNGLSRFESLRTRGPLRISGRHRLLARDAPPRPPCPRAGPRRPVRAAGRRASTRRSGSRATSVGSTQTTSSLRTLGIFGTLRERRVSSARSGFSLASSRSISAVVEAGADVACPAEAAFLVDAEHERAEAVRAAPLPLRVAGDDELLPPLRLDLQPVAAAPSRLVARVRPLGRRCPRASAPSPPRRARGRRRTARRADRLAALVDQRLQAARAVPRAAARPAARRRSRARRRA